MAADEKVKPNAGFRALWRFLPMLWPRGEAELKARVIFALLMVLAGKAVTLAGPYALKLAIDRMSALHTAVKAVRRGGTVSVSGVYGGEIDPMPMMEMFDRGITLRMGQCHVKRWVDEILPLVVADDDPLGLEGFATHRLPLEQAPAAYEVFQKKADGCLKVVLTP